MTRQKAVILDEAELCVRLLEIGIKLKRPPYQTAESIMAEFEVGVLTGQVPAYIIADFKLMARAACEYFCEQIDAGHLVQ